MNYNNIINALSKDSLNNIKKNIASILNEKECPICMNIIDIPVKLSRPLIHCSDCGDEASSYACQKCVIKWLKLNESEDKRGIIRHLICSKRIDLKNINEKPYIIDKDIINLLDEVYPRNIICECIKEFNSRNDLLNHMNDGSCSLYIYKCFACNFRGNILNYVNHVLVEHDKNLSFAIASLSKNFLYN